MTTRSERDFLKVQLIETQRLREIVGDHPMMSISFAKREEELREKLASLPAGIKEARTVLFFSGEPVEGSFGIDARFVARVLEPFQGMVMADYADRWHGAVGSRGRRAGEAQSRLLLTGLPRGSFGLELARGESNDNSNERRLADTLVHVARLVESSARSDEDFASQLDITAPRAVQNLREFLEVVSKGKAGLRIESGDLRCSMNAAEASSAFRRAADTSTTEEEIRVPGVLKGVLLESWRFDFLTDQNESVGGKIDENLSEEHLVALSREFFNEPCIARLLKTTLLFRNGSVRTTHTLQGIEAPPEAAK